jgi:uncharacterized membrane protein YeiB
MNEPTYQSTHRTLPDLAVKRGAVALDTFAVESPGACVAAHEVTPIPTQLAEVHILLNSLLLACIAFAQQTLCILHYAKSSITSPSLAMSYVGLIGLSIDRNSTLPRHESNVFAHAASHTFIKMMAANKAIVLLKYMYGGGLAILMVRDVASRAPDAVLCTVPMARVAAGKE